jgi:hypothetical protein
MKVNDACVAPVANVTVGVLTVPIVVLLLVTGTLNVAPGLGKQVVPQYPAMAPVELLSIATKSPTVVGAENEVVLNVAGVEGLKTTPDAFTVMTAVLLL